MLKIEMQLDDFMNYYKSKKLLGKTMKSYFLRFLILRKASSNKG